MGGYSSFNMGRGSYLPVNITKTLQRKKSNSETFKIKNISLKNVT